MTRKNTNGTLYWFTGLSGAGKTLIGGEVHERLRELDQKKPIFLDGDELRQVLPLGDRYDPKARKSLALSYAKLSKMLASQGFDVVCCTVSMFHSVREWSRSNIDSYVEVYVRVPFEVLIERNQKGLYTVAGPAKKRNVVGLNENFEEPRFPDIILDNDGSHNIKDLANMVLDFKK